MQPVWSGQTHWNGMVWNGHGWVAEAGNVQTRPAVYASGLTTGGHIAWGLVTLFTCGLGGIGWALHAFLGRRRIG